jgi:gamma-glutamylcyclotransferase (GGCT)/AIG2-like uncharacterized protein YtfP
VGSVDPRSPRPVFVYGTLRPGFRNWSVAAPFVVHHEPAVLPGHRLHLLEYPTVVADEQRQVVGDLLWLRDESAMTALAALDRFEDHRPDHREASLYVRDGCPVTTAQGTVDAWVYRAGPAYAARCAPGDEVESGEYREG